MVYFRFGGEFGYTDKEVDAMPNWLVEVYITVLNNTDKKNNKSRSAPAPNMRKII